MIRRLSILTLTLALALASDVRPLWAAPPAGQPVDGVHCDQMESNVFHIHAHLSIRLQNKEVAIPDDVGHSLIKNCLYWVHTHTPDGIIHIESPRAQTFTLGQFFDVWGEPLSRTQAGPARAARGERAHIWVDGAAYSGDPRKIELNQHTDIVIQLSPPFKRPPTFTAWNGN